MIRRMQKVFSSRYACTLSAAALAALLSACSPTSPTAAAKPAAGKPARTEVCPGAQPLEGQVLLRERRVRPQVSR
jgi:uncharacterized membrane protein